MDRIEFENKLLVQGGNLERWPAAEAEAARRLLAVDAESRILLTEALASDEVVRALTMAPLDTALIGRIMAATQTPPARRSLWSGWRPMIPAGALAVVLVASVGFKAGYDDGLRTAEELDIAAALTGNVHGLENLP